MNQGDGKFAISHFVGAPIANPYGPDVYEQNTNISALAGDFRGTGVPDIVVASYNNDPTGNHGGLSFLPSIPSAPGTYMSPISSFPLPANLQNAGFRSQVLGKFGPGGSLAVATLSSNAPDNLYVSAVHPDGSLGAPSLALSANYIGPGTPLVSADLNGDGRPDLVFPYANGYPPRSHDLVAFNNGDGTFTPYTIEIPPTEAADSRTASYAFGDFNGDGKLDLAIMRSGDTGQPARYLDVYLNGGNDSFALSASIYLGSGDRGLGIVAGDFDGDGKVDIAATRPIYATNYFDYVILKGNGDGTFQAPVSIASPYGGENGNQLVAADLRHDGRLDLVGLGYNVDVILNNGDGTFQAPVGYTAGSQPNDFKLADLNADGFLDVAVASDFSGLCVLAGNGDGTFGAPEFLASGDQGLSGVNVGDVNGDGRPDLVVSRSGGTPNSRIATTVLLAVTPAPPTLGADRRRDDAPGLRGPDRQPRRDLRRTGKHRPDADDHGHLRQPRPGRQPGRDLHQRRPHRQAHVHPGTGPEWHGEHHGGRPRDQRDGGGHPHVQGDGRAHRGDGHRRVGRLGLADGHPPYRRRRPEAPAHRQDHRPALGERE